MTTVASHTAQARRFQHGWRHVDDVVELRAHEAAASRREQIKRPGGSVRLLFHPYCAGMVINGSLSLPPVSESVKKNMIAVIARFVFQSLSSIQNQ